MRKSLLVVVLAVLCLHAAVPASVDNLMISGHWKRVRALAEARLKANPNDAEALFLASKAAASFGDLEKGLALAQRSVNLDPHNPDYLAELAEMHARQAYNVSVIKQVLYVRALHKELDTALAANPKHVDSYLVRIMFLSKAPVYAGGDRKRAHALADELARINPGWGYLIQARLAEQEKNDGAIEKALTHAIAAEPSSYQARYYLAKFHCCVSAHPKPEVAEHMARELIALDPTQSGGYEILARVYATQKRWAELDAVLTEAEAKVPEDLTPYYYAANTLFELGQDFDRADRFLRKYLSQEPEGRQPTASEGRQLLARLGGHKNVEAGM